MHRVRDGRPVIEALEGVAPRDAWLEEVADWIDVVKGDAQPLVRAAETLSVLRTIDAANRSATEGREVTVVE